MKNILRITAVFSVLFFSCILLLCSGSQCGVSAAGNTPQYDSNGLYIEDGILKGVKDRDIYYLEIPEGVTEIAPYALGCMNRLSCISLPRSLKAVGYRAFQSTYGIRVFYYPGTYNEYRQIRTYKSIDGPAGYSISGLEGDIELSSDLFCEGKRVTSLKILRNPDKMVINRNSHYGFDIEGTQVDAIKGVLLEVTFNDGSTTEIESSKIAFWPKTFSEEGIFPVTLFYGGKTVTFDLKVEIPLKIDTYIKDVSVRSGETVSVDSRASGKDIRCQWYRILRGENKATALNGATTPVISFTADPAFDGSTYYCTVTDAYGHTKSSNRFTLNVTDAFRILTDLPKEKTLSNNDGVTLSINVKGEDLKYQWYYKKKNASVWSVWKGRTDKSTTAFANRTWDGMKIRCVVTNGAGASLTSAETVITMSDVLAITSPLEDIYTETYYYSNTFFSASAKGTKLKYQWYYKKIGASGWSVWTGRTSRSMWVKGNDTWNGMQVRYTVTDEYGDKLTSNAATIYLKNVFKILHHPESTRAFEGEKLTFSVEASGNGLKYQWYYKKKNASGWTLWKGHTTSQTAAAVNSTWNGMQVYCRVTNSNGAVLSSKAAVVTISDVIKISAHPSDVTAVSGKIASFSVKATGSGLKYQWYYKKSGASGWTLWKEHNEWKTSAKANDTWNGMQVRCKITNSNGTVLYSNAATITIAKDTVRITKQPASISIPAGRKASFSVIATGKGLTYQWYYKKDGATSWSIWKTFTSANIEPPSNTTWNGMQVRCVITDSYGTSVTSSAAKITLIPAEESDFAILTHPKNVSQIRGSYRNATFYVEAKGSGLSYRWYYIKKTDKQWTLWKYKTSSSFTAKPDDTWEDMQVYCVVTNDRGEELYSDIARVIFN